MSKEQAPATPAVKNPHQPWYTSKLKGIPVEPGQDLRHVPREVINQWFQNLEARWKDQYNKRRTDGQLASMTIGRG